MITVYSIDNENKESVKKYTNWSRFLSYNTIDNMFKNYQHIAKIDIIGYSDNSASILFVFYDNNKGIKRALTSFASYNVAVDYFNNSSYRFKNIRCTFRKLGK